MLESRDNIFTANDELSFKQRYVIAFMAARASDKYESACSRGAHEELRNAPVEDACHLAECAWERWVDVIGLKED